MPEKFNLSAEEAIEQARQTIDTHEGEQRDQLVGIDADTAFDLGYRSALYDIDRYREDNPFEMQLVELLVPMEEASDD